MNNAVTGNIIFDIFFVIVILLEEIEKLLRGILRGHLISDLMMVPINRHLVNRIACKSSEFIIVGKPLPHFLQLRSYSKTKKGLWSSNPIS